MTDKEIYQSIIEELKSKHKRLLLPLVEAGKELDCSDQTLKRMHDAGEAKITYISGRKYMHIFEIARLMVGGQEVA